MWQLLFCCWVISNSFVTSMDCSPSGCLVQEISKAGILEWVAIFSSRWYSQPRDRTHVSCIGRWTLDHWTTWESQQVVEPALKPGTDCTIHVLSPLFWFLHCGLFLSKIPQPCLDNGPLSSRCCSFSGCSWRTNVLSVTPPFKGLRGVAFLLWTKVCLTYDAAESWDGPTPAIQGSVN